MDILSSSSDCDSSRRIPRSQDWDGNIEGQDSTRMGTMPSNSTLNVFKLDVYRCRNPQPRAWKKWLEEQKSKEYYNPSYVQDPTKIWNSSGDEAAGSLRQKLTTLFPVPLASLTIDGIRIDGDRHPFLCVFLASEREFNIPFERKVALSDY